jgi:hypothetical protein
MIQHRRNQRCRRRLAMRASHGNRVLQPH